MIWEMSFRDDRPVGPGIYGAETQSFLLLK